MWKNLNDEYSLWKQINQVQGLGLREWTSPNVTSFWSKLKDIAEIFENICTFQISSGHSIVFFGILIGAMRY
jgi:hypothetical protein